MKMIKYISLVLGIMLVAACAPTMKVTTDYDKKADFSKYKTFDVYPVDEKNQSISQLNRNRITSSVTAELTKKGLKQTSDNPDVLVNVVAILKNVKSVTANTDFYGYGGLYRPYAWGGGMGSAYTTYNVDTYKDGSLIIDIIDAQTKNLVWEGVGNQEIDKPLENPDQQIAAAVAKILAAYPPGK